MSNKWLQNKRSQASSKAYISIGIFWRAYTQSGQYHIIVESRVLLTETSSKRQYHILVMKKSDTFKTLVLIY